MELENGFSPYPDFFIIYNSPLHSEHVEIPSDYNKYYPKPLPQKAVLRKPEGTFWNVKWTMNREDIISFEDGWSKFVKDNGLIDGDFVLFTYDGLRGFWVRIYRNGLLVKATDHIIIHEISDDTDESTGDNDDHHIEKDSSENKIIYLPWGNSHDGAICEVNNARGSSKKDESTGNNDDHHMEEVSSHNKIIYLPWGNSHDGAICEVNNARGSSKKDESTGDNDDHHMEEISSENKIIYLPWGNSHDGAICEVNNARGSSKKDESTGHNDDHHIEEDSSENKIIYLPWGNSHDGAICEVTNARGSSKKDESTGDNDDHHMEEVSSENKIIYLPWGNSHDGAICEVNNARGNSKTVGAVKNDRAAIADPTAYLDDPKNPFFIPISSGFRGLLVIPMQIIKHYGLLFGRTINLIDGFGEVERNVREWNDCVVVYEWDEMYNRNNAKPEDVIICEVIHTNDIVRSIKVHFVKK